MSEEEKEKTSLGKKVEDLQKAVEVLLALEAERVKAETQKLEAKKVQEETQMDEEDLIEELKQIHLGELVRYAIKKNLIPRNEKTD